MPPKPRLNSIIICDTAILDAETRKRSLIGVFQNIRTQSFPCTHQMLSVYASVSDAVGDYVFALRLVEVSTDHELWKASMPVISIQDALHVQEICVRIMRITFPSPGNYEFQLHANDELLDLRRISLERITAPPGTPHLGQPPDGGGA